MLSRRRWMVGLGILIAGCCAAIPFQRQASTGPGPDQHLTLTNADPQLQLSLAPAGSTPSMRIEDHHRIESLQLRLPPPATAPRSPVQRVPSIEDRYPPRKHRPRQQTDQVSTSRSELQVTASDRYHRIQDGDTLRKLAEHYLGDAELAASIYDANRSILVSPDLLPLGQQLRIPNPR